MVKTRRLAAPKKKKKKADEVDQLRDAVIEGMQEKKAHAIVCLDLRKLGSSIADCFIVCHAESRTQVEAIAQSVEEVVYKLMKESPSHKEGLENAEWILLDYFNVVVHIFLKERREYYGIERLWADAEIQKVMNH